MANAHGGRRKGSGRKPLPEKMLIYSVRMSPAQAALLKLWGGGNMSAGLRWLVANAAPLVGPSVVVLKRTS